MSIDYNALIQRQATAILVRDLCREYVPRVSDRDLVAGVEAMYAALLELPIGSDLCYCGRLANDEVCDECLREALGL